MCLIALVACAAPAPPAPARPPAPAPPSAIVEAPTPPPAIVEAPAPTLRLPPTFAPTGYAARRALVEGAVVLGHDPQLTAEAVRLAATWRDLPTAIRGDVVAIAAHASPPLFARLLAEVRTEADRPRRAAILDALGTAPDVAQQRAALALVLDPALDIRDTGGLLLQGAREANRAAAQQFFRDHQAEILARYPRRTPTPAARGWPACSPPAACPSGATRSWRTSAGRSARCRAATAWWRRRSSAWISASPGARGSRPRSGPGWTRRASSLGRRTRVARDRCAIAPTRRRTRARFRVMRSLSVVVALAACSQPVAPARPVVVDARPVAKGLEPPAPTLRLPHHFEPAGYEARLAIDPARSGFDGAIAISGKLSERSSVIWLHARDLKIQRAVAVRGGAEIELAATVRPDELLELRARTPLDAGAWTLRIAYTGGYDERNTSGAFKQTVDGTPYIYTQFEAVYARRTFPCLDEPDRKVPWQLTLDVPAGLVAVSNTPIAHEEPLAGGKKRVAFARTKPLPSYLVAFGVGPFDVIDAGHTRSGTPVRIVTMKGRAGEGAWAAKTTPRLIDLLEDLFGSPFPYEKMDLLAIPITVGFGAMENAGLITFAETLMLLPPEAAAREAEYTWVTVAAHELAHQWFGDLVTTAWWDDIWLNEGFANWIERKISARFEPAWHEELAELTERNQALDADSLVSARQIRQPIATPDDILNAFDGITYNKGASVLNMFERYVGADVFQRGVRAYLAKHAFGNATSTEFAAAISGAADKDIGPALATFLEQPGAPELTPRLACDGAPRLELAQQRYVPPGAAVASAGHTPWIVPVCVAYDRDGQRAETCGLVSEASGAIALPAARCPRWVLPNVDGRGYYRVAYTAAQVAALQGAWSQLKPTERVAAFFDVASAAQVGKLPLALAMSFLPRLLAAGDRVSIAAAVQLPAGLRALVPEDLRPRYAAWMRKTFAAAARKAGLVPHGQDSLDTEAARQLLVDAAGRIGGDPALAAEAAQLANGWRDLPEAMRAEILAIAVNGSAPVFERLLGSVASEPDRKRRQQLIYALASVVDVARQTRVLGLMLDPQVDIRDTQEMLFAATTDANRRAAAKFFEDHKAEILKRMPVEGTAGGLAYFAYLFTDRCDPARRDEIANYVEAEFAKLDGGPRIVHQAVESMDQCIARRALIEPELRAWLK
jgi:alanyl aminopeptidase